jgi:hypothetical protein
MGWLRSWLHLTLASFAFSPVGKAGAVHPINFEQIVW